MQEAARSDEQSSLLRVADIVITASFCQEGIRPGRWGSDAVQGPSEHAIEFACKTRWVDRFEFSRGRLIFDSGVVWQLYEERGHLVFQFTSPALGRRPYKTLMVDRDMSRGEIALSREALWSHRPVAPLEFPLDQALLSELLGRGRGAEVHACGVVDEGGRGFLFIGRSGSGKSTIARLWAKRGATILSDERIVLRQLGGDVWMFGTPWHSDGYFADPHGAPLAAVFFPVHAPANRLSAVPAPIAAKELFGLSFPPLYSREALDFTLGFFAKVAREVPCHELRFLPEESALDLIVGSAIQNPRA
jgi:hypothetical protein